MANKNLFNSIQVTKPKNNVFDLTHDVKLSCNMGELIPILNMECVPGDKFNLGCESLLRFAPLVAPVMHRFDVTMHYFFVPYRILWDNWENFITNTKVSGAIPAVPRLSVGPNFPVGTYTRLCDYMGIPQPAAVPGASQAIQVNALHFAAYQKIYDEYYRDQNLIPSTWKTLDDGSNDAHAANLLKLQKRAWEHDYFTAALPWAQKGDPVTIPISGLVELNPNRPTGQNQLVVETDGTTPLPLAGLESGAGPAHLLADGNDALIDPNGTLSVENANTTINDLRRAYRLQAWLEKAARGGSRYVEMIWNMFGVKSSDKRLQRPEYITGVKTPVQISEVLQTSQTDLAPQGNMAGHAIGVTSGGNGHYFCEEHGCIIGIMSVLPKTSYFQGVPKHFLKLTDPFEHYFSDFANIGEQEIQADEIYAYQNGGDQFSGYVPRYAEYKYMPNRVCGDFATNLKYWHAARDFAAMPLLNGTFVTSDPTTRIFAVEDPDVQKLYVTVLNKIRAVRPMPKFGTPTF